VKDSEATRERILEAATAEFAAYGLAGARVDRIALAASANKNSIYRYFKSKDNLFGTVLERHLQRVYSEVQFTPEDLPSFAVRFFDYAMGHPDLVRLMAWYGLERNREEPEIPPESMSGKLAALAALQNDGLVGPAFTPAFLFTVITALASAWTVINPFSGSIDPDATNDLTALRHAIARSVERLSST